MERRQLEFFLAIAEAGSFTRASQVLHIAQPSLSHSMRTLEAELGIAAVRAARPRGPAHGCR